jgi:chromosome segregation protein
VVTEYEATRARLAFLNGQSVDLQHSAETLRATIGETRETMRARFVDTFTVVNAAFSRRFATLFGGGFARLVVDGGDEAAGVEVLAQPPGKRTQSLTALSGGERALTAAALLFALIEANPPPFCVLDEVDAALDESNVGRFCGALEELSRRTQFLVVTHNRQTMESAGAIYGLTLEQRSESRVLSLRLPVGRLA